MVKEVFADIIEELGKTLKIPLTPDRNNACLIKFKSGLRLQIEPDRETATKAVIISELGSPPPGRYRENLFREALKANGLPPPRNGIFAYGKKNDSLVLFTQLPLADLSGQKLADFLTPFMQKADIWRVAIERGETPSYTGTEASFSRSGGGMFGLR